MQSDYLVTTKDYGRVHNPYGSALLVDEKGDGYFALTVPLEGIPSVFGDRETFDINVLTELAMGVVSGKIKMQTATQEFFLTKENTFRLDQLTGRVLEYMVLAGNGLAYTINAEISYKFADIDNGDVLKGELTLAPSSFNAIIDDARPHIRQTLTFANTIPARIVLTSEEGGNTKELECKITESDTATVNAEVVGDASTKYTASWSNGKLTITHTGETAPDYAMVKLTASSTEKMPNEADNDKYAPYTLFADLSFEKVAE